MQNAIISAVKLDFVIMHYLISMPRYTVQIISLSVASFTGLVNFYSAETVRIMCGFYTFTRIA